MDFRDSEGLLLQIKLDPCDLEGGKFDHGFRIALCSNRQPLQPDASRLDGQAWSWTSEVEVISPIQSNCATQHLEWELVLHQLVHSAYLDAGKDKLAVRFNRLQ